ncbi:MAG TPA: TOBE domain-containing protein [Spirochaetota bacterium]|nr:TOBE domain-containing protein [Spirochaetota bacterium]HPJ33546.1 TOBE domain-containing protein [Spirochaetota bacterium]
MNRLSGKITALKTSGNMTLVDIDVNGTRMTAVTIGTPEKVHYLQMSKIIELIFNESEVSIGKITDGDISLSNQLNCIIEGFVYGEIFTLVKLSFNGKPLTSLITERSVKRLKLEAGDRVTAFIKTNEVMLKEPDGEEDAD